MPGPPKYAKGPATGPDGPTLRSPDAGPVLRLTLGEMPLEDALELPLPPADYSGTLGGLLDRAFPTDPGRQAEVISLLDPTDNPDAPEMYAEVLRFMGDWRRGRCALRFFANHGPEIEPAEQVGARVAGDLLDLVIEQRFTPLDYAVRTGHWAGRRELLDWLQESTVLLYATLTGQLRVAAGVPLAESAQRLADDGLLEVSPDTEGYFLSEDGEQALAGMMAEAESHAERYDVFADVLHEEESDRPTFGTGRGGDLRVAVAEAEGLDAVRTVYLLRMYDFSLEESLDEWLESGGSEEFFGWLLEPAVDRWSVDEAELEVIIEAGLAHAEEREEARLASVAQRVALRRADAKGGS